MKRTTIQKIFFVLSVLSISLCFVPIQAAETVESIQTAYEHFFRQN